MLFFSSFVFIVGLHKAGLDMLHGTQEAERQLEKGLQKATNDLYRGIKLAEESEGDVKQAKRELLRKIRRCTINIFRGVRKSRRDYRSALYKARMILKDYDRQARKDFGLDD
jgi:hypothetical protein